MKDKIYTIPVIDAFKVENECPLCLIEKKLEDQYLDDLLNNSVMDVHTRLDTNDNGFCRTHYELMYNMMSNRLALALMINSHMIDQNNKLKEMYKNSQSALKDGSADQILKRITNKMLSRQSSGEKLIEDIISELTLQENKCTICGRINQSMDRYVDTTLNLWFKEKEFRELFNNKKGFCRKHFKHLLMGVKKYMGYGEVYNLIDTLVHMEIENLERIQGEVDWFVAKLDYQNKDRPWENSRDALVRSISKIVGPCNLK